jgi:hypothetical protein
MGGSLGQQRQLLARLLADANSGLPAHRHQPLHALVLALASYQNVVKSPPAGLERLFNRVNSVQDFHDG